MALERQKVSIPLVNGIDTKIDDKQPVLGSLKLLQNAVYTKPKRFEKRNGFIEYGSNTDSSTGAAITSIFQHLAAYKSELLAIDNYANFYTRSVSKSGSTQASTQVWNKKGSVGGCEIDSKAAISAKNIHAYDSSTFPTSDYIVHAIAGDPVSGSLVCSLRITIEDKRSGAIIASNISTGISTVAVVDTSIGNAISYPVIVRPIVSGSTVYYFAFAITNDGGADWNLKCVKIDPTLANPIVSTATLFTNLTRVYTAGNLASHSIFDVTSDAIQSKLGIVYVRNTGEVIVSRMNDSFTLDTPTTVATLSATKYGSVAINYDPVNIRLLVGYGSSDGSNVGKIQVSILNSSLGTVLSATEVKSFGIGSNQIFNFDIDYDSQNSNLYYIYYSFTSNAVSNTYNQTSRFTSLYRKSFTNTGTLGSETLVLLGAMLNSKIRKNNLTGVGGNIYSSIMVVHASYEGQSSYLLIDNTGKIITRLFYGSAYAYGNTVVSYRPINKLTISPTTSRAFCISLASLTSPVETDNAITQYKIINRTYLTFSAELAKDYFSYEHHSVEFPNATYITDSILKMYDGNTFTESGFLLAPDITASASAIAGSFAAGTYSYAAVLKWVDVSGNIHRSGVSAIRQAIVPAGRLGVEVVPYYALAFNTKSGVIIEIYRTKESETTYYKVADVDAVSTTLTTAYPYIDTMADSVLETKELLYTQGGVLSNIAPDSCSVLESFKNRLFIAGLADNKNKLQFTKLIRDGVPPQFADFLNLEVDPRGGDITALKRLDDKLIIFKDDALLYMSGDGPNDLGEQDNFIVPELINQEVGCKDKNSIVEIPAGLMFNSKKGIYLLERNLNVSYIGAPIEDYNTLKITSAQVIKDLNQVRFTRFDDGSGKASMLVYDYFINQWAVFTDFPASSSTIVDDTFYVAKADIPGGLYANYKTVLRKENVGTFIDAADEEIEMVLETNWLTFNDVQGFERVYRMYLLGQYVSAHTLKVQVAYDFNDTYVQEVTVNPADFIAQSVVSGSTLPYQARIDFKKQKCDAIKIKISEIQPANSASWGEGLSLSNLTFEFGIKRGLNKNSQSNVYGTDTTP